MQKFLKGLENTKPMSLLRRSIFFVLIAAGLTASYEAAAGLAGFNKENPYTKEERILNLKDIPEKIHNYRADMRENLLMLIRYAKEQNPDFKIIAHEGQDLLTKSLWEYDRDGYNRARKQENAQDDSFLFHDKFKDKEPKRYTPAYEYLHAVDAVAINNFYCGKGRESNITKNHRLGLITIEQCENKDDLDTVQINAMIDGRASFGFTDIEQAFKTIGNHNDINDSAKNINTIADAQNILILTDDSLYADKNKLVADLLQTNYDIIIIKPLFAFHERFSADDLKRLHFKKNGAKRLLIAELNVSEAFPEEYYWSNDWKIGTPDWLVRKSFSSKDGVIVQFWNPVWKKIISDYFKDIMNEGFDGIFFTGIENYHYFEQQNPLE